MDSRHSIFRRENLRTVVEPARLVPPAGYRDHIMLCGSCFTEHIGNRLKRLKFKVNLNPFGIVYNPLSIAEQLNRLLKPEPFTMADLVHHQDLWHSWLHHSKFSHPDPDVLLNTLDREAARASEFLKETDLLIITFGTAEAFYLKSGDRLVSNCHQLPADQFYTRQPGPEELAGIWIPLLESLYRLRPDLRVCLTISPVRYFKSGPTGNQISKSILFLLVKSLMEAFPALYYFPSYEIFMDDLRDYRFYDSDMMHPGTPGIEYVWSRFAEACIDPASQPVMEEVDSLMRGAEHRPGAHLTDAHRKFVVKHTERIHALTVKYPFLDFSEEIESLRGQLESDQS